MRNAIFHDADSVEAGSWLQALLKRAAAMKSERSIYFTERGNAAGRTADDKLVVGGYRTGARCWYIELWDSPGGGSSQTFLAGRSFPTAHDADEYAKRLIVSTNLW